MRFGFVCAVVMLLASSNDAFSHERVVRKTYEGPDVGAAQEVVLKMTRNDCKMFSFRACLNVWVDYIDGNNFNSWMGGPKRIDELRLLPGKHRFTFKATNGNGYGFSYLWFVGEPGKTYSTQLDSSRNRYKLWIKDESTGLPVGGIQGSNDEPAN